MEALITEIKDEQGKVLVAKIWVTSLLNPQALAAARASLSNYVSKYVGTKGHNLYIHPEWDSVSAVITFDMDKLDAKVIQID
jgi:hypothetical protein